MTDSRTNVAGSNRCPCCQKRLDAATAADGDVDVRPKPGDPTICLYCTALLEFYGQGGGPLKLRPMTIADFRTLPARTRAELLAIGCSIRSFQDRRTRS